MATASERLRKQAKQVRKGLREMRGTAKDAAQERCSTFARMARNDTHKGAAKCIRPSTPSNTTSDNARLNRS